MKLNIDELHARYERAVKHAELFNRLCIDRYECTCQIGECNTSCLWYRCSKIADAYDERAKHVAALLRHV